MLESPVSAQMSKYVALEVVCEPQRGSGRVIDVFWERGHCSECLLHHCQPVAAVSAVKMVVAAHSKISKYLLQVISEAYFCKQVCNRTTHNARSDRPAASGLMRGPERL